MEASHKNQADGEIKYWQGLRLGDRQLSGVMIIKRGIYFESNFNLGNHVMRHGLLWHMVCYETLFINLIKIRAIMVYLVG